MALPTIICLKSEFDNMYLRYNNNPLTSDPTRGLLKFSGETPSDPLAQFEVIPSRSEGGLIHLKSRYTNKYFVRRSAHDELITPSADYPNENQSEWSCTLFKPEIIKDNGDTKKARLMHVQLSSYATNFLDSRKPGQDDLPTYTSCFLVDTNHSSIHDATRHLVTILDCSTVLKLPKQVVFKGDNGKYLGAFKFNGKHYLQFSFDNPNDPKVAHEVIDDDITSIKSKYFNKYWRVDEDDMIVADVHGGVHRSNTAMFKPKFIGFEVVTLVNLSKSMYCKRHTSQYGEDLLSASSACVDDFSKLEVKDLELK